MQTLIIDNYDSFTYNLFQMLAQINGILPIVIKNNQLTWQAVQALPFNNIIISPGPGHPDNPEDFGICAQVLREAKVPILGICLGHQGLFSVYGGKVVSAPKPMHGRICRITHKGDPLFENILNEFNVVRYHSLMADKNVPSCLEVIASSSDDLIMGIKHKNKPLWGIQFHPESICTEYGFSILENFNRLSQKYSIPAAASKTDEKIKFTRKQKRKQTCLQLWVKKIAYIENPVSTFQCLFAEETVVWLDSNQFAENGARFSFLGGLNGPLSYQVSYQVESTTLSIHKDGQIHNHKKSIFEFLKEQLASYSIIAPTLPFNFIGGFVGYLGYELKKETAACSNQFQSEFPDAQFLFLDRVIVFDHLEKQCYLLGLAPQDQEEGVHSWFAEVLAKHTAVTHLAKKKLIDNSFPELIFSQDYANYLATINKCLHYIREGQSYEICLTNKVRADIRIDPLDYYTILRAINPAPYSAFLKFNKLAIACSSMERFMHIEVDGSIETKPIKGTVRRGNTQEEDQQLIFALANEEKFKSENLMIVDLLRNDLGAICEIGSVHVPHLMQVETYETVHQLVSTIKGRLKNDFTAVDCIKATFPGGSMTGAPKIRTLSLLDTMETEARGIYSGVMGYFSLNGAADFNIVIRTAIIDQESISIGVGGAIVDLSDPEEEYEELLLKTKSLLAALKIYLANNSLDEANSLHQGTAIKFAV